MTYYLLREMVLIFRHIYLVSNLGVNKPSLITFWPIDYDK